MEQELLNQVFGDLISTCESYISNIVLKEDGADQLQEDLLVSLVPLHGLVKGCACSQNEGSVKFLAVAVTQENHDVGACVWQWNLVSMALEAFSSLIPSK